MFWSDRNVVNFDHGWDVVICTKTCTTGVNFTECHYEWNHKILYALCPTSSAIQIHQHSIPSQFCEPQSPRCKASPQLPQYPQWFWGTFLALIRALSTQSSHITQDSFLEILQMSHVGCHSDNWALASTVSLLKCVTFYPYLLPLLVLFSAFKLDCLTATIKVITSF